VHVAVSNAASPTPLFSHPPSHSTYSATPCLLRERMLLVVHPHRIAGLFQTRSHTHAHTRTHTRTHTHTHTHTHTRLLRLTRTPDTHARPHRHRSDRPRLTTWKKIPTTIRTLDLFSEQRRPGTAESAGCTLTLGCDGAPPGWGPSYRPTSLYTPTQDPPRTLFSTTTPSTPHTTHDAF